MKIDPSDAVEKLNALLNKIPQLSGHHPGPEFNAWNSEVKIALKKLYGEKSEEFARFETIWFTPGLYYEGQPEREHVDALNRGLEEARLFLTSRREDWEKGASVTVKFSEEMGKTKRSGKDVFVVHGHNHGVKETVARFLTKLGLNPIILHEQPDQGRTLIEKFEKYAGVSFAIAIFSGDDFGISKQEISQISTDRTLQQSMRPRARQNVVFEFGYLMGALGRGNVLAIIERGVETMSDYAGVLYIPFDMDDAWRLKLVKELKAACLEVDANAAFP